MTAWDWLPVHEPECRTLHNPAMTLCWPRGGSPQDAGERLRQMWAAQASPAPNGPDACTCYRAGNTTFWAGPSAVTARGGAGGSWRADCPVHGDPAPNGRLRAARSCPACCRVCQGWLLHCPVHCGHAMPAACQDESLEVLAAIPQAPDGPCAGCGLDRDHPALRPAGVDDPPAFYGPLCPSCEDWRLLTRPPVPSPGSAKIALPARQHPRPGDGPGGWRLAAAALVPVLAVLAVFILVAAADVAVWTWVVLGTIDVAFAAWAIHRLISKGEVRQP